MEMDGPLMTNREEKKQIDSPPMSIRTDSIDRQVLFDSFVLQAPLLMVMKFGMNTVDVNVLQCYLYLWKSSQG